MQLKKTFTLITHDGYFGDIHSEIFITKSPNNLNIDNFISEIKKNKIKHVVRLCGPTYKETRIISENISFYDWTISDGGIPSEKIISDWIELIKLNEPILVHCLAGLGRSPLLVVIGLINNKMSNFDAIELVRRKCYKSLNNKQIDWLVNYKPKKKSLFKRFFG